MLREVTDVPKGWSCMEVHCVSVPAGKHRTSKEGSPVAVTQGSG